MKQAQIEFAAAQIGMIDGGESAIFLETVNSKNEIISDVFCEKEMVGVFYSCAIYGGLRIHISFIADTDKFNEAIASHVRSALEKSGMTCCMIWIRNENRKVIEFLKEQFHIPPGDGAYDYASAEFIMRREIFIKPSGNSTLDIRPYEEKYVDQYLNVLDEAMDFTSPPPDFADNKEHYLKHFSERAEDNSFEAFWKDEELIGLYWRNNAEIDIMAVANRHQRKGFGSIILTRAIDMAFANTAEDYAYLYAVDWNKKGQSFYRKYGMEQKGHSYLLRLNNRPS